MCPEPAERRLREIKEWLNTRHVGQAFQPAINLHELRHFAREDLENEDGRPEPRITVRGRLWSLPVC